MIIDIFIKTCKKDEEFLFYTLRAIKKYISGYRKIIVVTDSDHIIDKQEDISDIEVINLPPQEYSLFNSLAEYNNFNLVNYGGYIEQQVIKMSWYNYTDADMVLSVDSDRIAQDYFEIRDIYMVNGKPIWIKVPYNIASKSVEVWRKGIDKAFGRTNMYYMNVLPILLERDATIKLNKYFYDRHYMSLKKYFFNPYNRMPSEFNFYGAFIDKYCPDKYKFISPSQFKGHSVFLECWSWGGINQELKERLEKLISK